MAGAKVRLISPGMKALLNDPGVRAELTRRMEPVLAAAQASARVVTGGYKNSLQVWQTTTDRAVVMVGSPLNYSGTVEASTGNLAKALNAAGGA